MLLGKFDHQLDAKNRIRIPAKFRSELGDKIVFIHGINKCIRIYSEDKITDYLNNYKDIDSLDIDKIDSFSEMMESIKYLSEDNQGRIVLPESYRTYAGINKDIVFIGMRDHIEIYSKEERERIKNEKTFAGHMQNLQNR